jgi:hypothetical protein
MFLFESPAELNVGKSREVEPTKGARGVEPAGRRLESMVNI